MSVSITEPRIPLPPIAKTPTMRLIEARDPQGRDVREVVKEIYDRVQTLDAAAEELSTLTGETVSRPSVYGWIRDWGWRLERVLVVPDEEPAGVALA